MAKDSVFNAASVIRKLTGEDLSNYDLHVNVVGGGRIDGPSAERFSGYTERHPGPPDHARCGCNRRNIHTG